MERMMSQKVVIKVPEKLLQYGYDQNRIQQRVLEWLVLSLFTDGMISSGKAAHLPGISRIEFLDLLYRRGIAYLNFNAKELAEEFDAVERMDLEPDE